MSGGESGGFEIRRGGGREAGGALYMIVFSYAAGLLLYGAGLRFFIGGAALLGLAALAGGFFMREAAVCKGAVLCLCIFVLAGCRLGVCEPERDARHLVNTLYGSGLGSGSGLYKLRLEEDLQQRAKTFRATASMEALWQDSLWRACTGKVLLYFPKEDIYGVRTSRSASPEPQSGSSINECGPGGPHAIVLPSYGDIIYLKGEIKPIEGFTGEDGKYFDYAAFMARRGVYGQCFLRSGSWRCEPWQSRGPFDFLQKKALCLRARLAAFFDSCGMGPSEAAVAKALVLGQKTDDPVQQAYRDTGIVHVLAVSGMHLSIFAVMATTLFAFLNRRRGLRYLQFVLVNALVWGYALLTGMAPSVSRAACMFTFISLGGCLGRRVPVYRSLAVSALVLLAVKPNWLQEMGFLLSYSAVLGLVFLSPLMEKVWRPRRRLPKAAWSLVVSSCAAQLATLPVILHSFGTFPTYFLLANLLVTPIVNVALPLGLITSVAACVHQGGAWVLAVLLRMLIKAMNVSALWLASWPAALMRAPLSLCSAVLFYLTVLFFYRTFKFRHRTSLPVALTLICLVVLIG